jgi:putative Mg2+ transporter-C (MgtC) family protein
MHEPLTTLPIEQAAINLAAAAAISSVIGFERQWHNGLAGLRTNNLVALGAATLIVFSDIVPGEGSPVRIAAQAVSGIGLLGAGLIFREGLSVSGLNTAANLWCSTAVSVILAIAAVATSFVAFINLLLRPIVGLIDRQRLSTSEREVGHLISDTIESSKL